MPRPSLPIKHVNPHLKDFNASPLPPVKYQTLDRDGSEVLVGRMKVPTPSGHAFILRRFDTGAISLTTMFRAAFPAAGESEEKKEMNWVKDNYDLSDNNGSAKNPDIVRLAGTWVDPDTALVFADSYAMTNIIQLMNKAQPDPNGSYRRSTKSTPKAEEKAKPAPAAVAQTPAKKLRSPSPAATPNPSKRRKEASPAPAPARVASPPRRSQRTRSPPPSRGAPSIASVLTTPDKPSSRRSTRRKEPAPPAQALTPGGSDETAVDDDAEVAANAGPDMSADIAEQREMIAGLKAQREAALGGDGTALLKQKRALEETEDTPLQFDFDREPEVGERAIATNRRVGFHLEPRQKSFAWGALAFAAGLGAITYLPSYLF